MYDRCRCRFSACVLSTAALMATAVVAPPAFAEGPKPLRVLPSSPTRPVYPVPFVPTVLAAGINDAGQIVGRDTRPLLWGGTHLEPVVLGSLGGVDDRGDGAGSAQGINSSGHVVGWSLIPNQQRRAFLWTAQAGMFDLGTLGGDESEATDLNDIDIVVGIATNATGDLRAFRWSASEGMVDIGTLGGATSEARAINNTGHIVGWSTTATGDQHAFLWSGATGMIDLGTLGGPSSAATDINGAGTIVGWSDGPNGRSQAFVVAAGGVMADLTHEDDGQGSQASAINEAGWVVGAFRSSLERESPGFLWTPAGGLAALGRADFWEAHPRDLNNDGFIVGAAISRVGTLPAPISRAEAVTWYWSWDDVIVDRGALGLWLVGSHGTVVSPLFPLNPTTMARGDLDGNGVHDVVMDLDSGLGVWVWMNQSAWFPLHPMAASRMVVGDLDGNGRDDVVVAFRGDGLWAWLNNAEWQLLHPKTPDVMAIRPGAGLAVGFPGEGVWLATRVSGGSYVWRQIHPRDPSLLFVADLRPAPIGGSLRVIGPASEVAIGFVGAGLWTYDESFVPTWTNLHPFDVRSVAASDLDGRGLDDLVIDFGAPYGLWVVFNGTTWVPLHGFSSARVALADLDGLGRDEIVIDFGAPYGAWAYSTLSGWRPLVSGPIEGLVPGVFH